MAPRVLVCVEDAGVAHVIAARLQRDGVDGVVVDVPARLVDEARRGAAAVAVQHRYQTGEVGSSLLRQVRVARGEVVPAVVVVAGDLSGPDRLVYERQYKVTSFLPIGANPADVAVAAATAAGVAPLDDEVVLHEDERKNEFDISIESQAQALDAAFDGAFEDDDDPSIKTVEISKAELQRLKGNVAVPAPAATEEGGGPPLGEDGEGDLSRLPPPGGDNDVDLDDVTSSRPRFPQSGMAGAWPKAPPRAATPPPMTVSDSSPPAASSRSGGEGEAMQIQELQRTQAELKKALLAERKAREAAQKRVEELELKLTKMGDAPVVATQGVPAEGVFEDLRYPALLARFRAEAFTGALVMPSAGTTRTVFLKDGLPVAFTSSEPGQRIGKVLVAQGRITDEQYMKAATLMVEKSIKLTTALVELGLIDAESLDIEQRNLTRDQIIAGFELVQGRFTTQPGAVPDANTPTFDFGPGEIYVQGYRRYAPKNEMLAAYETLRDKYLVANGRLASYRPKLGLSGDDERFLRLLGEALTVEEAVERAGVTPEAVARLLSALQALDLVEEWSPGVEQFRSRLRAERQRHAEEIAALSAQHRSIEDRLLKAFEQALAGRGDVGALSSTLSEARAEVKEPPQKELPKSSSSQPSSSLSSRETRPSEARSAALGASGSSASLPSASSSTAATSSSLPPSSSSASLGAGLGAARAAAMSERGADEGRAPWNGATASTSGASTRTTEDKAGTLGSLSSTLQAAMPSPTSPPPSAREPEATPADRKYREGIEQASQDRLDEAEVTLREAVRLDATRPEYLTALARVLLANPRYERVGTLPVVRSLLDRAVTLNPDHAEASALHKEILAEMGG
jgi:DNA-binding transcriptional ArsR family regulator